MKGQQESLTTVVIKQAGHPVPVSSSTPGSRPGSLNPRWVETLMGLPVGWTMPSCASPVTIERMSSDCLGMESCQQQQNERSEC